MFAAPDTAVGDAMFTLYDGAVISTLPTEFSRDIATINGQGQAVGVDERRFGESIDYAPPVQWTEAPVELLDTGLRSVIGAGWDHDGQTPMLLYHEQTYNRLYFFRGDDLEVANVVQYWSGDLMRGTIAGERFSPRAAIIHHGLVVIATSRSVLVDGVYQKVGVDFFATQDYGATFERIPVAGGGYGVPVIEESVGMDRLQPWSFMNPFPVDGIDDSTAAWFPWADYFFKSGNPKGGQIGLFRADRPEGSDHWVISPNRLVYSEWIPEDSGGLHAHTAAVTTGGLISHWGDVGYRARTMFHKFDLENYETAPIESATVYGGYDASGVSYKLAPQPVAAAPSPVPGEHLTSGDETPDHVLSFGAMSELTDRLTIDAKIYQPEIGTPGGVYGGIPVLHLQWVQGVGYVAGAVDDNNYYYSPDGEQWIDFNRPPNNKKASIWLYGDRLLAFSDSKFWLADTPTSTELRPLQIAPGGVNEIALDPEWRRDPHASNSVRRVVYSEGAWRYQDTLEALELQAPAPPFESSAPVYEVVVNGTNHELGSLWLQPPGETSHTADPHVVEMWVANLGSQAASFGANQGGVDSSAGVSAFSDLKYFEVNSNTQWISTGVSTGIDDELEGRFAAELRTYYRTPGARFLVAAPYFGEGVAPTYPLAPQASGSDELESMALPDLGEAWSVGIVAHWPHIAPLSSEQRMPIASLVGEDGDAIEVTLQQFRYGVRVYVDMYQDGVLQSSMLLSSATREHLQRGDWFELVLSYDEELSVNFVISGDTAVSRQVAAVGELDLDNFQWADRTGDVIAAIDPILVTFDDSAWDPSQRLEWMASGLYDKAIFESFASPGDFNRDGVVDAADYTVWRDTLYDATPGRLGDINSDGLINEDDRLIWVAQYGQTGSGLAADLNSDGVVNAADYTVWRDLTALQVVPGTGADADGNGFIERADLQYWIDNYGATYATFDSLREDYFGEPALAASDGVVAKEGVVAPTVERSETLSPTAAPKFALFSTSSASTNHPKVFTPGAKVSAGSTSRTEALLLLPNQQAGNGLSEADEAFWYSGDWLSSESDATPLDEALAAAALDRALGSGLGSAL
ncbi:hypothetical protein [Botrimarina mediterranea]|uniref:hypothetical protein n=1 Tax=Botrimarina mediterranea TaxID=2528022 RepID=UPI001187C86B|nr:hypothetical protein K2D_09450 [Planctomycetes bacterium K2D]